MIKGIPDSAVDAAVATKLADMDLILYAHKFAGTLSGGNKRKLSVAMAMIGEPSIVFLDEPSTGMDPVARRHMWQVITDTVKRRGECSVILTTHSMEEAEALCTRLGIMVGGTLRCLGSGQRLRSRYARDYQIELGLSATHVGARDAVLALMAQHCPGFRLLEEQPPQMRFEVPLQGVDGQARALSSVFSMLQANRAAAGIANYRYICHVCGRGQRAF
jgi:ABC-type multidrug transport system ATPase subunit